jgi:hypothetical protein
MNKINKRTLFYQTFHPLIDENILFIKDCKRDNSRDRQNPSCLLELFAAGNCMQHIHEFRA